MVALQKDRLSKELSSGLSSLVKYPFKHGWKPIQGHCLANDEQESPLRNLPSISNIESARQQIQVHTLYAIAEALQVPVRALLPTSGPNESEEIDQHLPEELLPEERDWVKRILTNEME